MFVGLACLAVGLSQIPSIPVVYRSDGPLPQPRALPSPQERNIPAGGKMYFTYTWEYRNPQEIPLYYEECENWCKGKLHSRHTECTIKCDKACNEKHERKLIPTWEPEFGAGGNSETRLGFDDRFWRRLNGTGVGGGIGGGYGGRGQGSEKAFVQDMRRQIDRKFIQPSQLRDMYSSEYKLKHWAKDPCTGGYYSINVVRYDVFVKGALMDARGEITSFEEKWGRITIPNAFLSTWDREIPEHCACKLGLDRHPEDIRIGQTFPIEPTKEKKREPTGQLLIDTNGDGLFAVATDHLIKEFGINVSCTGMSEAVLSCSNPTGKSVKLVMMPGTVLDSADPKVQDILVGDQIELTVAALSTAMANIRLPEGRVDAEGSGFAMCLEMKKKPPTAGDKFSVDFSSDSRIRALAVNTSKRRFRGGLDQARLWILTDKASLAEINQRLIPRLTPHRYIEALRSVAEVAGLDLAEKDFASWFDASLLLGYVPDQMAVDWFVGQAHELHRDRFLDSLKKVVPTLEKLAKSSTEEDVKTALSVAEALSGTESEQGEAAALAIIQALPKGLWAAQEEKGRLGGVANLVMSRRSKFVEGALKLIEAHPSAYWCVPLANMSETATADQKSRAKALTQKFDSPQG